jgi:hypothetical protein
MYSIVGKAIDCTIESLGPTEAFAAQGCERAGKYPVVRVSLRTMPLDYYAD